MSTSLNFSTGPHKYDGYKRLGGDPVHLSTVIQPLREAFNNDGTIPSWAGVDLLRGWAFFIARAYRHSGGWGSVLEEHPALAAIVEAINRHPGARRSDRAPTLPAQYPAPPTSDPTPPAQLNRCRCESVQPNAAWMISCTSSRNSSEASSSRRHTGGFVPARSTRTRSVTGSTRRGRRRTGVVWSQKAAARPASRRLKPAAAQASGYRQAQVLPAPH